MFKTRKGFTLIELLVVIAIIAVLAVVVVLTLNPAELLRQSRDSNRISDTGTLKSALSLYLADVSSPVLTPSYTTCNMTVTSTNVLVWGGGAGSSATQCGVFVGTNGFITAASSTSGRGVSGSGWVPVNLSGISSGAPIGNLPVDPTNNATFYYAFAATSSLQFEIDAHMESTKYATTSATNVQNNDGGDSNLEYETGTNLNL